MVVVRISDTGSGMPPDVQRRIFEPFFTTKETGTGLGLCIAAQVMARHGGALALESLSDKGTTFALWIPIAAVGSRLRVAAADTVGSALRGVPGGREPVGGTRNGTESVPYRNTQQTIVPATTTEGEDGQDSGG